MVCKVYIARQTGEAAIISVVSGLNFYFHLNVNGAGC